MLPRAELYKYYNFAGRLFARIRSNGNVFVIDTADIGRYTYLSYVHYNLLLVAVQIPCCFGLSLTPISTGNFQGVHVYKINAKTGRLVAKPYIFKAGLGQKPENAEEAALLTTVANGLGVACVVSWGKLADEREYISLYCKEGKSFG